MVLRIHGDLPSRRKFENVDFFGVRLDIEQNVAPADTDDRLAGFDVEPRRIGCRDAAGHVADHPPEESHGGRIFLGLPGIDVFVDHHVAFLSKGNGRVVEKKNLSAPARLGLDVVAHVDGRTNRQHAFRLVGVRGHHASRKRDDLAGFGQSKRNRRA